VEHRDSATMAGPGLAAGRIVRSASPSAAPRSPKCGSAGLAGPPAPRAVPRPVAALYHIAMSNRTSTKETPVQRLLLTAVAVVSLALALTAAVAQDKPEPKPDADGFYSLFDGKSLDGWKVGKNPQTFKIEDGQIIANGPVAHLFYDGPVANHVFKNFHFKAQVMCLPKANSGIYFHTVYQEGGWPSGGYECQVNNTHSDPKKTGGLYGVKDVMNNSPVKDNEWFTYEIIVKGKQVVIKINGNTTVDWTEPADWKKDTSKPGRYVSKGTFALQGHDPGSKVFYKNIKVKPLAE
jgi:hypothetical protein